MDCLLKLTRIFDTSNWTGGVVDGFENVHVPAGAIRWIKPIPWGDGERSMLQIGEGTLYVSESPAEIAAMMNATLLVPPAKEPEPVPERPPMLLARNQFGWQWWSWSYSNRLFRNVRGGVGNEFLEVNESASDPEAVRLWKEETK